MLHLLWVYERWSGTTAFGIFRSLRSVYTNIYMPV